MTDSRALAKYGAVPSTENHTNVLEAGVGEDELYSTRERTLDVAQTKWTYFLLGCAILLPWSAMANATSFFLSRVAGSPIYPTFSSYWNTVYMSTKLICQFYCTFTSKQSSPSRRIIASIIAMIFLVTSLCLSTFIRGTPSTFFAFSLLVGALTAVAVGYLCTAVYAQAALLGAPFLRAVFSGQAAAAVTISVVQVASSMIALWGSSQESDLAGAPGAGRNNQAEEIAARIFFGVAAIFLCITLVTYTWLTRQPFDNPVSDALQQHHGVGAPEELTPLLTEDRRNTSTVHNSYIYQVFRQNLIFMFSLAYVFVITLAVYPAITARVQPVDPSIHPMLFTAVHFLVFNTGDLLGRCSCSFPRLILWSGETILAMSLLRTLFIPLILFCNVDRPERIPTVLPIIHSDILFMIIMLTIGYTNGYVSTLGITALSSLEHNPRLKGCRENVDVAATLGGSFIIVGLTIGALSSFGVQAMI
ncbi:nucleoside transporter-domain-containing protein [Boletus edulis]|uniref:Nucleoside transporter-domain-containing protein n=1 Tax=Boletus edulis BED1 TaxID=1328754 RepID=A0AAD4BEH7_BOLED|nr:nucleoside transporter-domain-containing protein [Boletus edulis]KAF8422795.1 nucleoside transporter-domain-containing protein [Boletus edulis BED1]